MQFKSDSDNNVLIRIFNFRTGYHVYPSRRVGDEYVAEWEQYDGPVCRGTATASVPAGRVDELRQKMAEVAAAIEAERAVWDAQHSSATPRRNGDQRVERGTRTPRFRPSTVLAQQRAVLRDWQAI